MRSSKFRVALFWFRRDLRTVDNIGLLQAAEDSEYVVPFYVIDSDDPYSAISAPYRDDFRARSLVALNNSLCQLGTRLIVRKGSVASTIVGAMREFDADALYFNRAYEPYERMRDERVVDAVQSFGKEVLTFKDRLLCEPEDVIDDRGAPFLVYTPFKKWLLNRDFEKPRGAPGKLLLPTMALDAVSEPFMSSNDTSQATLSAGQDAALTRLNEFVVSRLADYPVGRDMLDRDGTSILSAHLNFGSLSVRTAAASVRGKLGSDKWIAELVWREFYASVLWSFPHAEKGPLKDEFAAVHWRDDEQGLDCWLRGETGYPVVDAAMRELVATGWMHNRARMIVASFLAKDLLIDWQLGERVFTAYLTDYDLAQNSGGWQWTAGVGTDAQPYFRIFNPVLQSKKFDPDGNYIRKWIPELARVPTKFIHEPWTLSAAEQGYLGCKIGKDYPGPIVDHHAQRDATLAAYKAAQESAH